MEEGGREGGGGGWSVNRHLIPGLDAEHELLQQEILPAPVLLGLPALLELGEGAQLLLQHRQLLLQVRLPVQQVQLGWGDTTTTMPITITITITTTTTNTAAGL